MVVFQSIIALFLPVFMMTVMAHTSIKCFAKQLIETFPSFSLLCSHRLRVCEGKMKKTALFIASSSFPIYKLSYQTTSEALIILSIPELHQYPSCFIYPFTVIS